MQSSTYEWKWLIAFCQTQAIEVYLGFVILRQAWRRMTSSHRSTSLILPTTWELLGILVMASTITHPQLWFVLPPLLHASYILEALHQVLGTSRYLLYVLIGEILVILMEALWYRVTLRDRIDFSWKEAFGLSIVLNSSSIALGLVIN